MAAQVHPYPAMGSSHTQQHFVLHHQHPHHPAPSQRRPHVSKLQFVTDLSQCLLDFVVQLLPTPDELAVKEDVRKLLERLIRTIEPDSRLLSFGSTANGFSLRNSDMDLCCLIDSDERLAATDLVTMLGDLLERETKFKVKTLPHARIPIVKLSLDPSSPGLPHGIACDIGFENRLALENTRLLMCYAMIDPTRVRTMVLFLKVWSKRRKINSPYQGTLSSYGYVLLVIYFLVHVKNPPILPNLQQIPPLRPMPHDEYHMGEHNVWFFDDIDVLRQRWRSDNTETVAELLIDFFKYFSRDFSYNTGVSSIRAGLLKKESKGWLSAVDARPDLRERNRLCIEDPFETDYNVARCVTKDGLYIIRGEFMRASRILAARPERALFALTQLCEERGEEEFIRAAPSNKAYIPPRLAIPPQTPYAVGSSSLRRNAPPPDILSPPPQYADHRIPAAVPQAVPSRTPPEHMAPKRSKWTSPPPLEAPPADHTSFEDRLGLGLSLATSSTEARERERAYLSSSSNSEIFTDDEHSASDVAPEDDVKSVRSFTDEPSSATRSEAYAFAPSSVSRLNSRSKDNLPSALARLSSLRGDTRFDDNPTPTLSGNRGRHPVRKIPEPLPGSTHTSSARGTEYCNLELPAKADTPRRSTSGPSRMAPVPRMPLSLSSPALPPRAPCPSKIFYETTPPVQPGTAVTPYPLPLPINPFTLYHTQYYPAPGHINSENHDTRAAAMAQRRRPAPAYVNTNAQANSNFNSNANNHVSYVHPHSSHAHSHSNSTIIAPPTPGASSFRFVPPTPPADAAHMLVPAGHAPGPYNQYPPSPPFARGALGIAESPGSVSVESASPPSTSSSPSPSVGYASPLSSTSPRSADFGSPKSPRSQSPQHGLGRGDLSKVQLFAEGLGQGGTGRGRALGMSPPISGSDALTSPHNSGKSLSISTHRTSPGRGVSLRTGMRPQKGGVTASSPKPPVGPPASSRTTSAGMPLAADAEAQMVQAMEELDLPESQ